MIDTNVFVSALRATGAASSSARAVLRAALSGRYKPLFGNALWLEYEDLLGRQDVWRQTRATTAGECENILKALAACGQWVTIYYGWPAIFNVGIPSSPCDSKPSKKRGFCSAANGFSLKNSRCAPSPRRGDLFYSKPSSTLKIADGWRPNLPDEGDNHLIELAVAGNAEAIVTYNTKDFRRGQLVWPDLKVLTPAECLEELP